MGWRRRSAWRSGLRPRCMPVPQSGDAHCLDIAPHIHLRPAHRRNSCDPRNQRGSVCQCIWRSHRRGGPIDGIPGRARVSGIDHASFRNRNTGRAGDDPSGDTRNHEPGSIVGCARIRESRHRRWHRWCPDSCVAQHRDRKSFPGSEPGKPAGKCPARPAWSSTDMAKASALLILGGGARWLWCLRYFGSATYVVRRTLRGRYGGSSVGSEAAIGTTPSIETEDEPRQRLARIRTRTEFQELVRNSDFE